MIEVVFRSKIVDMDKETIELIKVIAPVVITAVAGPVGIWLGYLFATKNLRQQLIFQDARQDKTLRVQTFRDLASGLVLLRKEVFAFQTAINSLHAIKDLKKGDDEKRFYLRKTHDIAEQMEQYFGDILFLANTILPSSHIAKLEKLEVLITRVHVDGKKGLHQSSNAVSDCIKLIEEIIGSVARLIREDIGLKPRSQLQNIDN